jgi:murein DD-endopeptidase MepM/ murein hydrolase activator NlpD
MVSQLKSDTARANGAKSRGPTTPEGKEKSSRNALKHGLTVGTGNILLDSEDPDEFEEIFNKLLGIHEPVTPAEKDLVEEMVAARWRIRRMWTIETNQFNVEVLTQQSKTDSPDLGIHLAMAYRALADDSRSLALASRYEARLQRNYDRAYKTLRELQQERKSQPPQEELDMRAAAAEQETEPRASASGPTPKLPNEPTAEETRNPIADLENASNRPDRSLNPDAL